MSWLCLTEQGVGLLRGLSRETGPVWRFSGFSVLQPSPAAGGTVVLSAALLQLGSECDPKQVPRAVGIRPQVLSQGSQLGIPAIDRSPRADIPVGCLYLPSDTSPKNLPGLWAAHGTRHGQTGPCGCLPSHRGLQLQGEPVSTHGLMGVKLLSDRLGTFGCRGKRRATKAGWSRRQGARLLLGEALVGTLEPSGHVGWRLGWADGDGPATMS